MQPAPIHISLACESFASNKDDHGRHTVSSTIVLRLTCTFFSMSQMAHQISPSEALQLKDLKSRQCSLDLPASICYGSGMCFYPVSLNFFHKF